MELVERHEADVRYRRTVLDEPLDAVFVENRSVAQRLHEFFSSPFIDTPMLIVRGFGGAGKTKHLTELAKPSTLPSQSGRFVVHHVLVGKCVEDDNRPRINWVKLTNSIKQTIEQANAPSLKSRWRSLSGAPLIFKIRHLVSPKLLSAEYIQQFLRAEASTSAVLSYAKKLIAPFFDLKKWAGIVATVAVSPTFAGWLVQVGLVPQAGTQFLKMVEPYIAAASGLGMVILALLVMTRVLRIRRALTMQGLSLTAPIRADEYGDVTGQSRNIQSALLKAVVADLAIASSSRLSAPFITTIVLDFEQIADALVDHHDVQGLIQNLDQFYKDQILPFQQKYSLVGSPRLVFASKVWQTTLANLPNLPSISIPDFAPVDIHKYYRDAAIEVIARERIPAEVKANARGIITELDTPQVDSPGIPSSKMIANEVRSLCAARMAGLRFIDAQRAAAETTRRRHLNLRYDGKVSSYDEERLIKSVQFLALTPWTREDNYEAVRGSGCDYLLPFGMLRHQIEHLIVQPSDSMVSGRMGVELDPSVRAAFSSGRYHLCCSFAYTALAKRLKELTDVEQCPTGSALERAVASGLAPFSVICFYPQHEWVQDDAFAKFVEWLAAFFASVDEESKSDRVLAEECLRALSDLYDAEDQEYSKDYDLDDINVDLGLISTEVHELLFALLALLNYQVHGTSTFHVSLSGTAARSAILCKSAESSSTKYANKVASVISTDSTSLSLREQLHLVGCLSRLSFLKQLARYQGEEDLLVLLQQVLSYAQVHRPLGRGRLDELCESIANSIAAVDKTAALDDDQAFVDVISRSGVSQTATQEVDQVDELASLQENRVLDWLAASQNLRDVSSGATLKLVIAGRRLCNADSPTSLEDVKRISQRVSLLESLLVDILTRGLASERADLIRALVDWLAKHPNQRQPKNDLFNTSILIRTAWSYDWRKAEEPSRRLLMEFRCYCYLKEVVRPSHVQAVAALVGDLSEYVDGRAGVFEYASAVLRYKLLYQAVDAIGSPEEHFEWSAFIRDAHDNVSDLVPLCRLVWKSAQSIQSASKRLELGVALVKLAVSVAKTNRASLAQCYDWAKTGLNLVLSNGVDESDVWERCANDFEELERAQQLSRDARYVLCQQYRKQKKKFKHGAIQHHPNKIRLISAVSWNSPRESERRRSIRLSLFAVAKFMPAFRSAGDGSGREILQDYAKKVVHRLFERYEGRGGSLDSATRLEGEQDVEASAFDRFCMSVLAGAKFFPSLFQLLWELIEYRANSNKFELRDGDLTFARVESVERGKVVIRVAGHSGTVFAMDGAEPRYGNISKIPPVYFRAVGRDDAVGAQMPSSPFPVIIRRLGVPEEGLPITARGWGYISLVLNLIFPIESESDSLFKPVLRTRLTEQGNEIEIRGGDVFLGASNSWLAWRLLPEHQTWLLAGKGWLIRDLQDALYLRRITLFPRSPDRTREGIAKEIRHFVNNSYAALKIEVIGRRIAVSNLSDDPRKTSAFKSMFLKIFDRQVEGV